MLDDELNHCGGVLVSAITSKPLRKRSGYRKQSASKDLDITSNDSSQQCVCTHVEHVAKDLLVEAYGVDCLPAPDLGQEVVLICWGNAVR